MTPYLLFNLKNFCILKLFLFIFIFLFCRFRICLFRLFCWNQKDLWFVNSSFRIWIFRKLMCFVDLCFVDLCFVDLCFVDLRFVDLCFVDLCFVILCFVLCFIGSNQIFELSISYFQGNYSITLTILMIYEFTQISFMANFLIYS